MVSLLTTIEDKLLSGADGTIEREREGEREREREREREL
jgi:hypothetical protein